jgi:hypothetical protein
MLHTYRRHVLVIEDRRAMREKPGAAFRPSLPVPDGASTLDRILTALGRSPGWQPAAG